MFRCTVDLQTGFLSNVLGGCHATRWEGGRWQLFLLCVLNSSICHRMWNSGAMFGTILTESSNKLSTRGVAWRCLLQSGNAWVSRSQHLLNMESLRKQNSWSWASDNKPALAKPQVTKPRTPFLSSFSENKCFLALLYIWEDTNHTIFGKTQTPDTLSFETLLLKMWQWACCMSISWELVEMQNLGLCSSLLKQNLHFNQTPRWFPYTLKFEDHYCRRKGWQWLSQRFSS